jgi:hypothetical protein
MDGPAIAWKHPIPGIFTKSYHILQRIARDFSDLFFALKKAKKIPGCLPWHLLRRLSVALLVTFFGKDEIVNVAALRAISHSVLSFPKTVTHFTLRVGEITWYDCHNI